MVPERRVNGDEKFNDAGRSDEGIKDRDVSEAHVRRKSVPATANQSKRNLRRFREGITVTKLRLETA
jgi:hypothetical protein